MQLDGRPYRPDLDAAVPTWRRRALEAYPFVQQYIFPELSTYQDRKADAATISTWQNSEPAYSLRWLPGALFWRRSTLVAQMPRRAQYGPQRVA
jgi:hypothetical protein